jgi:Protein of unknown function (DUF3761)
MTLARVLAVVIALGFCSTVSAADVACKDGTTSKGGQGACSGHGGIDKKATKKANKEEKKSDKKGKKEEQKAEKKAGEKPDKSASAAPRERSTSPRAQGRTPSPSRPSVREEGARSGNPQNADAAGAIARCKDGTYSHAKSHSGACSRHGGVAEWLDTK